MSKIYMYIYIFVLFFKIGDPQSLGLSSLKGGAKPGGGG